MKKTRKIDNPYEVRSWNGWTWKVLKSYHNDTATPYARAFCAVSSPYTFGGYDLGDVYWADIENVPIIETNY